MTYQRSWAHNLCKETHQWLTIRKLWKCASLNWKTSWRRYTSPKTRWLPITRSLRSSVVRSPASLFNRLLLRALLNHSNRVSHRHARSNTAFNSASSDALSNQFTGTIALVHARPAIAPLAERAEADSAGSAANR